MPSISGALAVGGSGPDHRAEASLKKSMRFGAIASIKQKQWQTGKRQNELQRRVAGHIGGRVPLRGAGALRKMGHSKQEA